MAKTKPRGVEEESEDIKRMKTVTDIAKKLMESYDKNETPNVGKVFFSLPLKQKQKAQNRNRGQTQMFQNAKTS